MVLVAFCKIYTKTLGVILQIKHQNNEIAFKRGKVLDREA